MRWLLLLLIIPLTASAEPIVIRSGEHETFSRLVLTIGEGVEWDVSRVEGGYQVQAVGSTEGFDTSQIFERIPRTRIASASEETKDVLKLGSTCDCHIDAFLWRPGQLVVDVIDGPDPNTPPVVETMSTDTVPALFPSDAPVRLPDILALNDNLSAGVEIPTALQAEPRSPELAETEAALIEGIARAASQGFLDAAITVEPVSEIDDSVPSQPNALREPEVVGSPLDRRPGIGVSTAMDRDLAVIGDLISAQAEPRCLPAILFETDQWATEEAFHTQVASLAEALVGEFGEEPREAEEALTRLYLYFGFGAEARAMLEADQSMSQSRQVMLELAGLIDEYGGPFPMIESQSACKTPAALWAFLAHPRPQPDDMRNHIIRDFFRLAQPLRGQLTPRMAQRFLEVGDDEAARQILQASEGWDTGETHEAQAARALLSEAIGNPDEAIAVLEEEANDNARTTPQSLIRLIDLALQQGQTPTEADLVLADAMRQEYRDTPIAAELAQAEARGRVALGQYQIALDLLEASDNAAAALLVDQTYAHMTQHADAGTFLEYAYGSIPEALTDDTENAIARRLIEVGFPERAAVFLEGSAIREAAAARRYLRAEAALAEGNYVATIDALIGLSDERARQLRTLAFAGLGQHEEALVASGPGASNGDEALQFRAGAWERLADQEDAALSTFADVVITPESTDPAVSLADSRALLSASQESRRAVEGLLSRFDAVETQE